MSDLLERFQVVEVAQMRKAPWNIKGDDAGKTQKLKASMTENGVIKSCNVRELGDGTYEILDGNHRLDVFLDLEIGQVLAYNHGPISEEEGKLIAHQLLPHFDVDREKHRLVIERLTASGVTIGELSRTTRWSEAELRGIVTRMDLGGIEKVPEPGEGEGEGDGGGGGKQKRPTLTFLFGDKAERDGAVDGLSTVARAIGARGGEGWKRPSCSPPCSHVTGST